MTEQDQLKAITEMRDMMNKSSRFLSLSGLSGVAAGCFAIVGVLYARDVLGDLFLNVPLTVEAAVRDTNNPVYEMMDVAAALMMLKQLIIGACVVLALSVLTGYYFSQRKSKKQDLPFWDDTAKRMTTNLAIPLVAGGLFCLVMISNGVVGFVPGATLLFYGMALLNASKYTLKDIWYLGLFQILLGLAATVLYPVSLLFWAGGFGLLHIIYGIVLYFKYEMKQG